MGSHRGCPQHQPENSLAGFREALEAGAQLLEFDVQLSRDGVPVVIHDFTLERTTSGRGRVQDMAWDELRALDAGGGVGIPHLEEVLELVGDRAWLDIELKTGRAEPAALVAAVAHSLEAAGSGVRVLVSSFDHEALVEAWRLIPQVPRGVLVYGRAHAPAQLLDSLQADLLLPEVGWLRRDDVEAVHEAGGGVGVWVVNDDVAWAWAAGCGVDAVLSDRPEWALARAGGVG